MPNPCGRLNIGGRQERSKGKNTEQNFEWRNAKLTFYQVIIHESCFRPLNDQSRRWSLLLPAGASDENRKGEDETRNID